MSSSSVVFALAKVLISAAWSDGRIIQEERLSLKDLIFHLPNITGQNWANLEMYLESPIIEEERRRLIEDLRQHVSSPEDKELALRTLQEMVEADGVYSEEEKVVVQEVHAALEGTDNSALENLSKFLKGLINQRSEHITNTSNRELLFEDYMNNKIYYNVQQSLKENGSSLELSESDLRKLCLAGGMMARIAQLNKIVTKEESIAIVEAFKKHWNLEEDVAHFIAKMSLSEACVDLEYYRLSRLFYEMTTEEERKYFIDILFDVARSDGEASHEETEEIRLISKGLKLDHGQFILAKTSQ